MAQENTGDITEIVFTVPDALREQPHTTFLKVRGYYEELMWTLKAEPMEICLAQLGGDAGMIGAAGLALRAYEQGKLGAVGT